MTHKITYEFEGIKVSIEADENESSVNVSKAIEQAKMQFIKFFDGPKIGYKLTTGVSNNAMKKTLSVKEAAEILQVCDRTMYRLVKRAMITENMFNVVKLGQVYRINRESFLNWIDSIESISL